jgi:hypothetical protein
MIVPYRGSLNAAGVDVEFVCAFQKRPSHDPEVTGLPRVARLFAPKPPASAFSVTDRQFGEANGGPLPELLA